jgi:hypothetical protein
MTSEVIAVIDTGNVLYWKKMYPDLYNLSPKVKLPNSGWSNKVKLFHLTDKNELRRLNVT